MSETGASIILITHDLGVIAEMAERVLVMYAGQIVEEAPVKDLFANPLHPYTNGLLKSIPVAGRKQSRLEVIPGSVPDLLNVPTGCRFELRCQACQGSIREKCKEVMPALKELKRGIKVRCHLY
jgi:oligopeptide/dipeptide ABC transporter ATP-binding protein